MADINSILNDKKKVWSVALFSLLCAFAFAVLVKYDFGNFHKMKLAIAERKSDLVILDSLVEYKKYLKEFAAFLAPGEGVEWLMMTLAETSRSKGVTLNAIRPSETISSGGYKIITLSVEGASSYKNLIRFIEELEARKECIFIEKVYMKATPGTKGLGRDEEVVFTATIASVVVEK
ncbi:MAG: GspMb/PilO family protein [Candidatus Omnitrophota bacterium]